MAVAMPHTSDFRKALTPSVSDLTVPVQDGTVVDTSR